jgi:hypothetical protein
MPHKSTKAAPSNKLMGAAPVASADDMKWRARDALSTLKRAEEIQRDKGLMRAVKTCAREEMKALAKVASGKKK